MTVLQLLSAEPLFAAYVAVFGAAALACFAGAWRARRIERPGVRHGLLGLLSASGLWAATHVGLLLAPTLRWKIGFYEAGLVIGFATVWAWLWFCSAYSGRALHRSRVVQRIALFVFGAVTLTKLTNPLHELYFSAGWHAPPFRHLQVDHHLLYWGTVALSYMGAAVGLFMLAEPLRRAKVGSGRLAGLFGLTVLPLVANGLGYVSPRFLDVSHEPVGVAAFAIGVLFVYSDRFEETGQAGRQEKPALVLSEMGRLRNYNGPAAALFPALAEQGAVGTDLTDLLPEVAEVIAGGKELLQVEEEATARYYWPTASTFGDGGGRRVVLTDVTEQALRRRAQARERRFLGEAVEQAHDAVLVTEAAPLNEPGPRIVYANEAFEAMTGYAEEEVLGKTPRILQGPETERAVLDSLRAALEAGTSWKGETVNYRKDGTPYRVHWNIAPVRGEDGQIEHWISVQRNVTEQQEREEQLRKQKSLLAQTQRLAGAWEFDLRAGEISWSEKVYQIHEVEPGTDVSPEEALQFYVPKVRSQVEDAFEQCVEAGKPYDLELPIVTAEGNRRWVRTVGAPVETSGGEVTKVAGAFQDITERKEAEEELRRSREQLSMAVEGGNIGTWNWDLETDEVIFNRRWAEMLGYSREELDFQFSTWEELVHPKDLSRAMEVLDAYIEGKTDTYDPEIRMRTKSGDWKWIQTVGKVVERGEDGTVTRAAGIHLDIDKRKRAEDELQRSRERYRSLFEDSNDAILVHDLEGRIQEVNPQAEELFGREAGELEGQSVRDLHAPEDKETAQEKLRVLRAGESYQAVSRYERGDGSAFWGEVSANVTEIGGRAVVHTLIRDVTERKRREERLRRRRQVVESLYDATGRLLRAESQTAVSDRIHEVLGEVFDYPLAHTGFVDGKLVVPERTEAAAGFTLPEPEPRPADGGTVIARALQAGEAVVVEDTQALENPIDYGDLRSAAGVPIGKRGGIVIGKAQAGRFDPTDLHLLEVLGNYAALVLGRLNREEELLRAKEEAEEANRMKSSFLANMSHEIRTPLTSILGFAEAIGEEVRATDDSGVDLSGVDLPALREFARLIESSGKRLMSTLTGVLNLSKLEAGKMDLTMEPVDLADQAAQVAEELRPQADEKGIRLHVEGADGPVWAQADTEGVQIVLRNLLSNAIKYTEEGEVRGRAWETEEVACLEVEDTGIGMDPDTVANLFEPFRQESEGRNRVYEGTGLGLAVTSKVIDQMNGSVEVETEKGEGSRFTVRLPLDEQETDE